MKPGVRCTAVLSAATILAGCAAVGPDYVRPALQLPAAYSVASAAPAAAAVAAGWWRLYHDATLEDLVVSALENNADIRLAAARVEEAEAIVREARGAYAPEVSAGVSRSRSRVSTRTSPMPGPPFERPDSALFATTAFEIDFWGRLRRTDEAANAALLGTRHARAVVGQTIASAVAQSYFTLRALDARINVLGQTIAARRDSLALARARLNAGLAPELDVHQAQGVLADALVQQQDARRQRALFERLLGQLSARPDLKLAPVDLFTLPVPPTPPPGLPSALLERRPDVRAAEQSLAAATALIGAAKANLFPRISLTGTLGTRSAEFSDLLSSGSGFWALAIDLLAPIFDNGRRQARVDQATARMRQSLASYAGSVEAAFREVSDSLVNLESAGATESDLRLRLEAARSALQLSTIRYESGYSPYLEVLDAQRTANDAELALVQNRQARLAFSVDLMKSLGGGWEPK